MVQHIHIHIYAWHIYAREAHTHTHHLGVLVGGGGVHAHAPGWVGRVCKAKLVLGGRWWWCSGVELQIHMEVRAHKGRCMHMCFR